MGDLFGGGGSSGVSEIAEAAKRRQAAIEQARVAAETAKTAAVGQMTPYSETGFDANKLTGNYLGLGTPEEQQAALTQLQNSPGFQFQLQTGVDAIDNAAAARGLLGSGGRLKELTQYGQNLGLTTLNERLNQLNTLSNRGFNASTNIGNYETGYGEAAGNAALQSGEVDANRILDSFKAQQAYESRPSPWGQLLGTAAGAIGGSVLPGVGNVLGPKIGESLGNFLF